MSKIAFIFPGQGSQYIGMGKDFYDSFPVAKTMYDKANEILGFDLIKTSFEGPEDALKQTRVTQPAIFVHSIVTLEILKEKFKDMSFQMSAGHSLGEYSALVAAGVLSFEDALKIVKVRAAAMQHAGEVNKGTMAAVIGMDAEPLGKICCEAYTSGIVQCANYNSPGQIVISGSIEGVKKAMELAKEKGARMVKELVVSGAFHSPLMESAKEEVQKLLNTMVFRDTALTVYPNVTARAAQSGNEFKKLLVDQITAPVKWHETVVNMIADGANKFYEIGPGNVLQGLVKRIDKNIPCECIGKADELVKFQH
ncbi:ACP S-malonyltransferase [bacterium]|nr:ACP S-malonyltransferase [bacterium]